MRYLIDTYIRAGGIKMNLPMPYVIGADLAGTVAEANAQLPAAQQLRHILATRFTDAMPAVLDPAETPAPAILQWLLADPPLPAGTASTGVTRWADALAAGHRPGAHTAGPDDLALLPYTSGTTGLPKGCMHTHRTLMHNVMQSAIWGFGTPEAVSLGVVPMFHITGFIFGCLGTVAGGNTTVMLPRWDRELAGRLGFGRMNFLDVSVAESTRSDALPERILVFPATNPSPTANTSTRFNVCAVCGPLRTGSHICSALP